MNAFSGTTDDAANMNTWRGWKKLTDPVKRAPVDLFVLLDEHPDSINDAFFVLGSPTPTAWGDFPASYHNKACGFSFADGHSEIHKWLYPTTKVPVKVITLAAINYANNQRGDFDWIAERVGPKR